MTFATSSAMWAGVPGRQAERQHAAFGTQPEHAEPEPQAGT